MAYKFIGGSLKGIAGYPKDDWIYPNEIVTDPAQIAFIESMNEVNRKELFEKVVEAPSKKSQTTKPEEV